MEELTVKKLLDDKRAPIDLSDLPPDALKEVQELLNKTGAELVVDGLYGLNTKTAYLAYLREAWIAESTEIGWGSLASLYTDAGEGIQRPAPTEASVSASPLLTMPGLTEVPLSALIVPDCGITWGEMTRGGTRLSVSPWVTDNMVAFAKGFVRFRRVIGKPIRITSAYRPPDVNRRVGGASKSFHLFERGGAIDFFVDDEDVMTLYNRLRPHWSGGLAYSIRDGFVHADNGDKRTWKYN